MGILQKKYDLDRIEVAFIIIVVLALLGVGVWVWQSGRNKQASISSFAECVAAGNAVMESYPEQCAANGQTWSNPDQVATEEPEAPVEVQPHEQNSLAINEWGVKIPLTSSLEGLRYQYSQAEPAYAYLVAPSVGDDSCTQGVIIRFKGSDVDPMTEQPYSAGELIKAAKIVGDYYYVFQGSQALCSDNEALETMIRSNLKTSVDNIATQ